ncbi:MAG: hypothetical protein WAT39_18640 [Planctomycetota bacterium]
MTRLPSSACVALLAFAALVPSPRCQSDPVFDDFERHTLGPNWLRLGGSTADIIANSDLGSPQANGCVVAWVGSVFAANQFNEVTTATNMSPDMLTQVFVRQRLTDNARYGFHWNGDGTNSRWEIKFDGVPTAQTRLIATLPGPGPAPGSTLRLEVYGSDPVVLRAFVNGQPLLAGTDPAPNRITGAGRPGLVGRLRTGVAYTPPMPIFEQWRSGSQYWFDEGQALAGTGGLPRLAGTGALVANNLVGVDLANALPQAPAFLAVGFARLDLPLLGGTLVPSPDIVLARVVGPAGTDTVTLVWPAGFPSGFSAWWQQWIVDAGAPQSVAASNALLARVQ